MTNEDVVLILSERLSRGLPYKTGRMSMQFGEKRFAFIGWALTAWENPEKKINESTFCLGKMLFKSIP